MVLEQRAECIRTLERGARAVRKRGVERRPEVACVIL
jgi:hypothetical protein